MRYVSIDTTDVPGRRDKIAFEIGFLPGPYIENCHFEDHYRCIWQPAALDAREIRASQPSVRDLRHSALPQNMG